MKPRILFILHLPPPVHGAAMVGSYIQQSLLINQSFECDYVNLSTSNQLSEIGKGGIKKLFSLINIQLKVLKLLLKNKYDICYITASAATPGFYKDLLIIIILKIFRANIVYHFHNKGVALCSGSKINNVLYRFAFKNTKSILLSKHLYNDIQQFVSVENTFYCANGIPVSSSDFEALRSDIVDELSPVRLLFLSNMMVEKGVMILLEACVLLKNRSINFECHFVGPWSDVSEVDFLRFVESNNLQQFVFSHGKQYNEDKLAFFRLSDVFVFPTFYRNECFPLVLLEAMQYSLPVISTSEGGIADILIDNETGFLVEKKDIVDLAEKLESIISDKPLRIEMGVKGKERFDSQFILRVFEKNIVEIFKQIV